MRERRPLFLALVVALVALPLSAAEISVLSGAAVQGPLLEMASAFRARDGHVVTVTFDTVPNIMRRLDDGDRADVLIATEAGLAQAIKAGRVIADSRVTLGRVGVGVAVSRGSSAPDISSVDALKGAIRNAAAVVTSQGTSGVYVMKMLADLGVLEQVKSKTIQVTSGVAVMERLGATSNEIGFTQLSEVMYGEAHGGGVLVGPLPAPLQNFTTYQAGVMTTSAAEGAARQFTRSLVSEEARLLLRGNGWEFTGPAAR